MTKTSENPAGTIKALSEGRRDTFLVDPENLVVVTDKVHPLYDERVNLPIAEEFIANVMEYGVLQNVLIRRNGPLFEVVDGRQRVRAAIEANKRRKGRAEKILVPVTTRREDDADSFAVTISANEHRTEDTPLVKARKADRLLKLGKTEEQVATCFRMSVSALRQLLSVLESDKSVQDAVESGEMAVTAASKLTKLSREDQKAAIKDLRASGTGMSRGVVKEKVRAKAEANRTGQAEAELILPPKRSLVAQVCDAYTETEDTRAEKGDQVEVTASALLKWVLTGRDAKKVVPGPGGFENLDKFLKDLAKPKVKASEAAE